MNEHPQEISAATGYVQTRHLFSWALKGNKEAVDLCMAVLDVMDNYDHLVDNDIPESKREETMHDMVWKLAVSTNSNAFFRANSEQLTVTMANAIISWRTATALQRAGDLHGARIAYVLRWVPMEFFLHCATIIGGYAWVNEIAPQFWRIMTRDYPFEEFLPECGDRRGVD